MKLKPGAGIRVETEAGSARRVLEKMVPGLDGQFRRILRLDGKEG